MTRDRWIAILTAFAVLALPALSLADHHKAGGKAEEHRSEKAAENSNAQWDDDNDGPPDRLRGDHDDDDGDDDKDKREKRDKKEKKEKKDKKGKKDEKGSDDDD